MAKKISRYEEIMDRLSQKEPATTSAERENVAKAVEAVNKRAEAVRRDYQIKERQSQYNAQQVVLNS